MNICTECYEGYIKNEKMDVTHRVFNFEITVKDVPVTICDSCGYTEYIYPRELDFQLRDAYRNKNNLITFELHN